MKGELILVGTAKGLVVFKKGAVTWEITEVHFKGMPVTTVYIDERTDTWWIGLAHRHWGQKLQYSLNQGASWQSVAPPVYPKAAKLSSGKPAVLKKIWTIQHAGNDRPGALWIGTEPGGLFYTPNNGRDFQLVESLWNHPSRLNQNQWFGAGRDHPFLHSIVVDAKNSNHIYIAVSCAGVFESKDNGQTWTPCNQGLIAAYLPNPNVEVGHDPHRMLACHSNPNVIWQQNHCGIFRSQNGGQLWDNVTDKNGIADYGFALAIDPESTDRAWVIPAISDEERIAHNLALCVCRTEDGGKNWKPLRNGLPQNFCFDIVFRHALAYKNNKLAFGTTTGNVYLSEDGGENWTILSQHLARVETIVLA